jgi:hypothetical protein
MKITKKLVSFGVSGVLPGTPNTGKRKMAHYYCTRCDLATFSDSQKGTSKPLKWAHILLKITPKSPKFMKNTLQNHYIFDENHQKVGKFWCFWGAPGHPEYWKTQNGTLLLYEMRFGNLF